MPANDPEKRPVRTGVVMDPIDKIKIHKDSTFAMMLEAQRRGHELLYMEPRDLHVRDSEAVGTMRPVNVKDDKAGWYTLGEPALRPLADLDVLLMRRDPPFDMEYVYATYVLDLAEAAGVQVVNAPQALRDANEKAFITHFPQCTVPMLMTHDVALIRAFVAEHGLSVVKPLDTMGGESIFQLRDGDPNFNVILEGITQNGKRLVMAQKFIPEITKGDKRVLIVDGEPVSHALARIPGQGEFRGNLARGARGEVIPISERDEWIARQVGPELKRRGILFAGIDVIGDWLTEVNVTSPTCIREIDAGAGLNVAGMMFDAIEERLG